MKSWQKESNTREVPAEIDTEKNRGLRATVYRFDKEGKVVEVYKRG